MISEKTFLRLLKYQKVKVQKEYEFKTKNMEVVLAKDLKKGDRIETLRAGILTIAKVEVFEDRDLVIVTYNNGKTWEFCLDDDIEIQ